MGAYALVRGGGVKGISEQPELQNSNFAGHPRRGVRKLIPKRDPAGECCCPLGERARHCSVITCNNFPPLPGALDTPLPRCSR